MWWSLYYWVPHKAVYVFNDAFVEERKKIENALTFDRVIAFTSNLEQVFVMTRTNSWHKQKYSLQVR